MKNGVICLVSMFPSWVMVLKLSKKVYFLQFCTDLKKKFKSIKAIYMYASERSRYALSQSGIFCYAITYYFGDLWFEDGTVKFLLINNISLTVAQTPINHTIFRKSVMNKT